MKIHPTALIEAGAQLGEGVEIGPYSVIGAGAVIGARTVLRSHVVIEGTVHLGEENCVGHGCIIGGAPQDLGFNLETLSRVEIGNGNVIRELCTIHRGTEEGSVTRVGQNNFLMAGVHVGHNSAIGDGVIIANNCLLGGYVRVDDGAFIGGGSTFHQHMHVGRLVMCQGRSGFSKDIPPFLVAAGRNYVCAVNVLGLRRAGVAASERDEIRRAFKLLYRSGLNTQQAAEQAGAAMSGPLVREFFDFVRNARKRGIVPYRHNGASEG